MSVQRNIILLVASLSVSCATEPTTGTTANTTTNAALVVSKTSPSPCSMQSPNPGIAVITAPCNGSSVSPRDFVEGTVSDANAKVWVVVHSMETSDYWVQPAITLRQYGHWRVLCYFGENGNQHSGKRYEVLAITNPRESLSEGQLFAAWPDGQSKSQIVEVVRR